MQTNTMACLDRFIGSVAIFTLSCLLWFMYLKILS